METPSLSASIAESIAASARYNSGMKSSVIKLLKDFLDHDEASVRAAGLSALASTDPLHIRDEDFASLLNDPAPSVRHAVLDAMLAQLDKRFQSIFEDTTDASSDFPVPSPRPPRSTVSWLLGGIFGRANDAGGTQPAETESEAPPDEESQTGPDDEESQQSDPADEESSVAESEPELPPLAREQWLQQWRDGSVAPQLNQSGQMLGGLVDTGDIRQQAAALACQAILGIGSQPFESLTKLAASEQDAVKYLVVTLPWQPLESRSETLVSLVKRYEADVDLAIDRFASVRNPAAAPVLWQLAEDAVIPSRTLQNALLEIYFGPSVSYYTELQNQRISNDLLSFVRDDIVQRLETDSPVVQKVALALLRQVDLSAAHQAAKSIRETSQNPGVRDVALRVLLIQPQDEMSMVMTSEPPDRSFAIELLDTDQPAEYLTVLRYLLQGNDSLLEGRVDDDPVIFDTSFTHYYGHSSADGVKVRIPKAPRGMKVEHLDRPELVISDESKAYVAYFQTLLGEDVSLKPLIEYWNDNDSNEEVARLLYEAVATSNDDSLIPEVESAYEMLGRSDVSFSAGLYWTIRVMDSPNARALRKRMRKEIGMNALSNH